MEATAHLPASLLRGSSPYTRDVLDARYSVGDFTYGRPKVLSWCSEEHLTIGKFCSIADEVVILLGGEHTLDWVSTYPFSPMFDASLPRIPVHARSKGDVVIGNDVWIGFRALILSGVMIGDGAVIGAGAVVARNVDPYAVVVGNPARHLRQRFSADIAERLLALRWWDWPVECIRRSVPLLRSVPTRGLLERLALVVP